MPRTQVHVPEGRDDHELIIRDRDGFFGDYWGVLPHLSEMELPKVPPSLQHCLKLRWISTHKEASCATRACTTREGVPIAEVKLIFGNNEVANYVGAISDLEREMVNFIETAEEMIATRPKWDMT